MPVFLNPDRKAVALISYKVLYSRFTTSGAWNYQSEYLSARQFVRMIRKCGRLPPVYQVVRHPENRLISFFADKLRIQPKLASQSNFRWQPCHRVLMPLLGINEELPNEEIADRFLNWSFQEFIRLLPEFYMADGHTHPQTLTARIFVRHRPTIRVPFVRVSHLEKRQELDVIPDVDFDVHSNASSHVPRDFEVTDDDRQIIRSIYEADFRLGRYSSLPESAKSVAAS